MRRWIHTPEPTMRNLEMMVSQYRESGDRPIPWFPTYNTYTHTCLHMYMISTNTAYLHTYILIHRYIPHIYQTHIHTHTDVHTHMHARMRVHLCTWKQMRPVFENEITTYPKSRHEAGWALSFCLGASGWSNSDFMQVNLLSHRQKALL